MAGRLVPYKGVEDAIEALALMPDERWRLVVIGVDDPSSPREKERLQRLADQLGAAHRVVWLPHIPEVGRWLSAFDAVAVLTKRGGPRTPGKEGFGTIAFEAMLAGVPVVAVQGGAVVRRLAGRGGIGVPEGSPGAVAAALVSLSDAERRRQAGAAGRELVSEHPDARQAARDLVDVLASSAQTSRLRRKRLGL